MRACVTTTDGRVAVEQRPDPVPGPGEVLVRVAGAGVNQADLLQRAGHYPAPPGSPADVPGLEFAGTVVALGSGVTGPATGTRVMGIAGGGGQAELITVPVGQCATVPGGEDLVRAGGIPEAFVTAHDALVTQGGMASGDVVLIHAVGSGVGTAALQIAAAVGAITVGTSRTPDKLDQARGLGLGHAVLVPGEVDPDAVAAEIRAAAGRGIDVTIDLVGGRYVGIDVRAAAPGGRIIIVSAAGGGRAEIPVLTVMQQRLRIQGTVLRPRSIDEKVVATAAFARDVVPFLASGRIAPVIADVLPLAEANAAYDRLAGAGVFGKLVLDCT